jgi:hypothetical protein
LRLYLVLAGFFITHVRLGRWILAGALAAIIFGVLMSLSIKIMPLLDLIIILVLMVRQ